MSTLEIWTVGHSNHEFAKFAGLLRAAEIELLVDVRSYPYSRFAPQFNREELQAALPGNVRYAFQGESLGGRPGRDEHYDADGHALYALMAQEPGFSAAIDGLLRNARAGRVALLCSCGRPHDCHRRLLVGKVLCERGAVLRHILADGTILPPEDEVRLGHSSDPPALFGDDDRPWRSAQSVSHRRRLSASSSG